MTISIHISRAAATSRGFRTPAKTVLAMWTVHQERRALAKMDPNRLKDIGISQREAATEVARPFWDLPHR